MLTGFINLPPEEDVNPFLTTKLYAVKETRSTCGETVNCFPEFPFVIVNAIVDAEGPVKVILAETVALFTGSVKLKIISGLVFKPTYFNVPLYVLFTVKDKEVSTAFTEASVLFLLHPAIINRNKRGPQKYNF
jgi:hypothetical protein